MQHCMAHELVYYHNPRCSKSREAKKILDERQVDYETVLYLDDPPSLTRLKQIAKHVDGGAVAMLRDKEAREEGFDPKGEHAQEEILRFIADHPRALQRPILVRGDQAVVGRPPGRVEELL